MTARRFVLVEPPPYYAYWEYRAGEIAITMCRYLFGQHRIQVTWHDDVLPLEF